MTDNESEQRAVKESEQLQKYVYFRINKKTVLLHRFVMNCYVGDGITVHHVHGNGLDNRREYLEKTTRPINLQGKSKYKNRGKRKISSRYKGVTRYVRQKGVLYRAQIAKAGKTYYLGMFEDEKEAAKAYNQKAMELFKDMAVLNKVS